MSQQDIKESVGGRVTFYKICFSYICKIYLNLTHTAMFHKGMRERERAREKERNKEWKKERKRERERKIDKERKADRRIQRDKERQIGEWLEIEREIL